MAVISVTVICAFIILSSIINTVSAMPTIIERFDPENLTIYEKKRLWSINMGNSKKFNCQPQPRTFLSSNLLGQDASINIFPNNVVLHRCDSQSGCCTEPNHVCGEDKSNAAILMFKTHNKVSNQFTFESLSVYNHTQCKCTKKIDDPKRLPEVKVSEVISLGVTNDAKNRKSILLIYLTIVIQLFITF